MSAPILRTDIRRKFWENIPLEEMTSPEWEALCDGCGKCCLLKLEDEDTNEIHYTNVSCRLFDPDTCACGNYALRKQLVAGCVVLTPGNIERNAYWMPSTCAYRLLFDGDELPDWHPLITGNPFSTHAANASVKDKTVAEYDVEEDDLEYFKTREFE